MEPRVPRAVFLPLSAQLDDPETVSWARGVPLLVAEDLRRLGLAEASFACWTSGSGANLRLTHLQTAPPVEHVTAYARAARAEIGVSGWASWHGDPFVRWQVTHIERGSSQRVDVDASAQAGCLEVARKAFSTARLLMGLMDDRPPPVLTATESDMALFAWLHDRELLWRRRRKELAMTGPSQFRHLLSALGHDPEFEPAARQLVQRAGHALEEQSDSHETESRRKEAIEAMSTMVGFRRLDHVAWTLLGMLQRVSGLAEAAESSLRTAVALQAEFAPAHRELGALFLDKADHRSAGAHLRKAGKLAPKDPEVQYLLGVLYLGLLDRSRGAQHLSLVLRLAPDTDLSRTAARMLRDIDDGPSRQPTNALPSLAPDRSGKGRDRDLIARTFGFQAAPQPVNITSPGDDFLDRLADEACALAGDEPPA